MAPVLPKSDLGTGVSLSQLSLRSFNFHIKGEKKRWFWSIRGVTGREETSWQDLYQPISPTAWHGKTARHSSHRRSVSWLSLRLSGSSATSLLLIVTHLAARHDWAAWRWRQYANPVIVNFFAGIPGMLRPLHLIHRMVSLLVSQAENYVFQWWAQSSWLSGNQHTCSMTFLSVVPERHEGVCCCCSLELFTAQLAH